jgi:two-component system, OmpR family, alkaline phosphatase synthesis response regulator PhoP
LPILDLSQLTPKSKIQNPKSKIMKILFAEDEPDIQFVARIALEDEGHQIVTVDDGQAAFERALAEPFDVILLDVMMPRLDGLGACRKLQDNPRTHDIPVIFLTARSQQFEIQAGLRLGALGYIIKPFDTFTLASEIANLLALRNKP